MRVIVQQPALPKYRVPVFRELARRPGIDLTVVYATTPGLSNAEPGGFKAEHVPMWRKRLPGGRSILWHPPQWTHATAERADVLVLSWDVHYASLVPALLRARANGVPTILWGHGYSKQEAGWRRWTRESVATLATALLFYNHTAADRFVKAGWPREKIHVALNSLDQSSIQAARRHWLDRPKELAQFRRDHGLHDGPVVLFVSRLEPDNRVDLLLNAAALLREQLPSLRVVIIGKGPDEPTLREAAQSLGLADRVLFPGAIYEELQLAPWFLSADVFCYPQNMGLSLLHAFGYGLPVVTSDQSTSHGPEIEALLAGENGLLFHHGDSTALSEALRSLLLNEPLRRQLGDTALRTVRARFSLERMVDGFVEAIEYCCRRAAIR